MLDAGAIHLSQSLWCNTVVLVRKKDGTLHFFVDFRHLNMWMRKDSYPLPCIQEALESMVGSPFLVNGFKVRLLANKDGSQVTAIHNVYGG